MKKPKFKDAVQAAAEDYVIEVLTDVDNLAGWYDGNETEKLCALFNPEYPKILKRLSDADTTGNDLGDVLAAVQSAAFALGLAAGKRLR